MKRNVVRGVLARLAVSLAAIFLILTAAPAMAGDRALFNFIGYSQDGTYAAFEEYGEWDGVGGFYSHIYIVNLHDDSWVTGSPYLVDPDPNVDEDTTPVAVVRMKALALAKAKLDELKINVPGEILYLLGDGMGNERGKFVTFSSPSYMGTGETLPDATTLALQLTGVDHEGCEDIDVSGFILDLYTDDGKTNVHDDSTGPLPKSRGCTIDYSIYAVIRELDGGPLVAIVSVYTSATEGPDRRFMLVPLENGGRPPHADDGDDNADDGDDAQG